MAPRNPRNGLSPFARYRLEQATIALIAALAGAAIGVALTLVLGDDDSPSAPAPQIVVSQTDVEIPETAEQLGFPGFATRNTTRIAGENPVVDAAGAALAGFPASSDAEGAAAVSLVGDEDWTGALAAASLVAEPVAAPILLSESGSVPEFTEDAIAALRPRGSRATGGAQAFEVGDVDVPDGLRTTPVRGDNPAEIAAAAARLRRKLAGDPAHFLLVSSDEPEYAMPAAAWAARSGDPVLFVQKGQIPRATAQLLRRNREVPAYVLGPESIVASSVTRDVRRIGNRVRRVEGADPVTNAIAFARYADATFGWDINDPGHGFAIANVERPLDLAAAASIASRGKPGPLLLTDDAASPPAPLRGFLLDTKPGYFEDPTRAVYNHVWLIGDTTAIGVGFQVQVDDLTNLERVRRGSGAAVFSD